MYREKKKKDPHWWNHIKQTITKLYIQIEKYMHYTITGKIRHAYSKLQTHTHKHAEKKQRHRYTHIYNKKQKFTSGYTCSYKQNTNKGTHKKNCKRYTEIKRTIIT